MKKNILKYSLSFLLLFLGNVLLFSQPELSANATNSSSNALQWIWSNIVFLMGIAVIIGAVVAFFRVSMVLVEVERLHVMRDAGILTPEAISTMPKESFWERLNKKAWRLKPMSEEKDIMLDHDYDGIHELDNHLPPWWIALFYAGIFAGVGYYGYFHLFNYGLSSAEEYQQEMVEGQLAVEKYLANQKNRVDESNVIVLAEAAALGAGKKIFTSNCVACHGALGEGTIGPNLTDEYWLHGGDIKEVFATIKYGVSGKGMQAWNDLLSPVEMQQVASYILSLKDSNPPNGKAPEGEIHKEEE